MTEVESRNRRLLLISNLTLYGSGYLDHAEIEIEPESNLGALLASVIEGGDV